METPSERLWQELIGQEVVLDLASPFVALGLLVAVHQNYLELVQVDVHDLRDTQTTREKYVVDCRAHGVRPNRARAWISLRDVIALSRLADVLVD